MAELAARLWCENEGQALTEYALALILIGLLMITSMKKVTSEVCEVYAATARKVARLQAPDHESGRRDDNSSSWSSARRPGLGGSSQVGSSPAENSSDSLSSNSLR